MSRTAKAKPPTDVAGWIRDHEAEVRGWGAIASNTPRQTCLVDRCDRDPFAVGVCKTHWIRAKYHARRANGTQRRRQAS